MRHFLPLIALSLAGCATVKNNYIPVTEQISFPKLNEVRTATLGEEMLKQGTATTTKGVLLPQQNQIGTVTLSKGFYPQTGEDEKFIFTSFEIGNPAPGMGRVSVGGLGGLLPQGLRFDKRKQQTCAIVPNVYGISQPVCDTEHPFQFTERPIISSNNFQQTLIYSGRVGERIRVSYREFSGNVARAPFSNEAEYDLSSSNIIAYKGARIEVIEADNESIKYKLLANFNTQ